MNVIIEPWRTLAGEILSGDPAVMGLLDLVESNPDTPNWRRAASEALSGDVAMQSILAQVAMRARRLLADARATAEAIMAGRPIPRPKPRKHGL